MYIYIYIYKNQIWKTFAYLTCWWALNESSQSCEKGLLYNYITTVGSFMIALAISNSHHHSEKVPGSSNTLQRWIYTRFALWIIWTLLTVHVSWLEIKHKYSIFLNTFVVLLYPFHTVFIVEWVWNNMRKKGRLFFTTYLLFFVWFVDVCYVWD